ncbi:hypothetical protein ABZP36_012132 [Zizania latifolia]
MQVLFQGILDFVKKELNSEYALRCDCDSLIYNVELIQSVLREAEKTQLSDSVKLLFDNLKDVGYDAMEVLDEASYESIRHQVIHFAHLRNLNIVSTFNPSRMNFRHGMENKIKAIFKKIDDTAKYVPFLELARRSQRERPESSTPPQTCLRQTDVFGRKNDQDKIVKMLLRSDQHRIAVLPIVGEPYIGKTVVTTEVFSDERVKRHFDLRLWVHVSDDFDIQKITASIIEESIEGRPFQSSNLNTLQKHLKMQLQGERYLLVLDNYCSEEWSDWKKLLLPLLEGATGSKIIVTTRSDHVVGVVGTIGPYRLQGLAPDDCWLLFCQCAQTQGNNSGDSLPNSSNDPESNLQFHLQKNIVCQAFHDVSGGDCEYYVMGMEKHLSDQQKVRHLTINKHIDVISKSKFLRTLIVVGGSENSVLTIPNDIGQRFPTLHTLDLSNSGITELPGSIGKLKHLRCLQLQSTKIRQLPETICDLYLLQTLDLRNCYYLEKLPHEINNLRKLRHIDLVNVCELKCMPKDIGLLTELQTLSRFVISKIRHGGIGELANLNELNGELFISGLEHVNGVKEAADADLASKKKLRKIGLEWISTNNKGTEIKGTEIMVHLKPPTAIEELTISGYAGVACPWWLASPAYEKLVTLHHYAFKSCTVVPCLGQLPHLENLRIDGWDGLETMNCSTFCGGNTASFQSLKKLHLEGLGRLQRWEGDDGCAFPSLFELVIKNCNKLEQLTHNLPSLTKITVEGSPNLYGLRKFPSLTHVDVSASGEWIWRSWSSLASPISITLSKLPTVRLPSGLRWSHSSLRRLHISQCDHLESMPEDWLPCNLSHFSVSHCPQLRELPSGIRHLQALENLEISACGKLIHLPDVDGLTSLLWMEISGCGSIRSLPYLPRSMQFLSIKKCPQLTEGRLERYKINHIFSVWIDGNEVFTSADEPRFVIPAKKLQQG